MSNPPFNSPYDGPEDPFVEPVHPPAAGLGDTPIYDQADVETRIPPIADEGSAESKTDVAKEQAKEVGATAAAQTQHVASVAKDKASEVVGEARTQLKDLYEQSKTTLIDQTGVQQERVVSGLRSFGDELQAMADRSDGSGVASDLVGQVAARASSAATWLDGRDPGSLLDELRSYARRKPGTFIAIAAVAGVLAGRLTRGVTSIAKDEHEADTAPAAVGSPVPPPSVAPLAPTSMPTVPPAATGL